MRIENDSKESFEPYRVRFADRITEYCGNDSESKGISNIARLPLALLRKIELSSIASISTASITDISSAT